MSLTSYQNRHDPMEHHVGDLWSTLVEISSALGTDIPAGMTLQEALAVIDARICRLEGYDVIVDAIKLDALLAARGFLADAVVLKAISGGMTADAVVRQNIYELLADAILRKETLGSLLADAALVNQTYIFGASANAVIKKSIVARGVAPYVYSTAGNGAYAGSFSWTHTVDSSVKSIVVVTGRGASNDEAVTALSFGNKPLTKIQTTTGLNPYPSHSGIWYLDDVSDRDDDVVRGTSTAGIYARSIAISADVPTEILSSGSYPGSSLNSVNMTITSGEAEREALAFAHGWINKSNSDNLQSLSGQVNRWVATTGVSTFRTDTEYINGTHAVGFYVSGPNYASMVAMAIAPPRLSFAVDADILKAITGSVEANAAILRTISGSLLAESAVLRAITGGIDVSAFVQPYFWADAVISLSGEATFTFELPFSADILKTMAGQVSADAAFLGVVPSSLTADSIVNKTMPTSFTTDSVVKRTMDQGTIPGYSSVAGGTSGRSGTWSWTHTAASGVRSMVVVVGRGGNNSDAMTSLSYGNKTMTKIAESTGASPYLAHIGIWYLADTAGRADDVIRGTSSATVYANSIAITADSETKAVSTGSQAGASRNSVNMTVTAGLAAQKALGIALGWINKSTGDNLQSLAGQSTRWAQGTGSNYFKADTEPILGTHAIGYYISGSNYSSLAAVAIGQPFKINVDAVISAT